MLEMKYTHIPYVSKKVSRILFGTAMQPFLSGGNGNELFDSIYNTGVNTFDTARNYMAAEKSLGKWIAERQIRDKIVILSKCGHPSFDGRNRINEKDIRSDFSKSTMFLNTDYIDIYILHRDDLAVQPGEAVEIFNSMHSEGKIGAFGASNWTHNRINEANEYAYKHNLIPFSVSSPNFGLADQVNDPWGGGCVSISGMRNIGARKWYSQNQMPVLAYSSLGRGLFSGKVKSNERVEANQILDEVAIRGYGSEDNFERLRRCEELAAIKNCTVSQIAMAWIFNQDLNVFAVVSTKSPQKIQKNIEALHIELNEEEILYLNLMREAL